MTSKDELNPALQDAYDLLLNKILNCIDTIDEVTTPTNCEEEVVLAVAYNEMPRLTTALRGVVKDHWPDDNGNCPACGYHKVGETFELRQWPCPVVASVHEYLKDPARFYEYCPDRHPMYA